MGIDLNILYRYLKKSKSKFHQSIIHVPFFFKNRKKFTLDNLQPMSNFKTNLVLLPLIMEHFIYFLIDIIIVRNMSSNDDLSLTRVLVNVSKWSGKLGFYFFMISAILVAITISDANPSINYYHLNAGDTIITQSIHMSGSDNAQIFFGVDSPDEEHHTVGLITVSLIDENNDVVWLHTSNDFFKNIWLPSGDYHIEVTADQDTDFFMGSGVFDPGLVAISAIFVVMFAILMAIFWTVLPFTVAALIIKALDKKPPVAEPQVSSKIRPITIKKAKSKKKPIVIHPDSWFSKLTRNDWILLGLGVFFFFLFVAEPDGVLLFFAVMFSAIAFYLVTEREKTKQRILVLLSHYPETTVEFLALQLDKKSKDVIKTLKMMILDEAQLIRLDLITDKVTVVGELVQPIQPKRVVSPEVTRQTIEPITTVVPESSVKQSTVQVEPIRPVSHCTGCGEPLVGEVKYCYSCGQRQ